MRRLLTENKCIPLIGAYNGLIGKAIKSAGFKGCYLSGGALHASKGFPDVGLLTYESFCQAIKEIHDSCQLPILADADTGFGGPEIIRKVVYEYWNSGAGGFHIEDQTFPKRCGHLDGKTLESTEIMQEKVEAAKKASLDFTNGEFVVCARTDAFSVEGIDSAIKRAQAYIEAGADMIFPEGLHNIEDFEKFYREMKNKAWLLANLTEFGKTSLDINVAKLEEVGYKVVIFPVSTLRVAMKAINDLLEAIKNEGSQKSTLHKMQTRKELYSLLDYNPNQPWEYKIPKN
ncbi:unnamed protein product [Blepharisma stoltei]|uniref:Methylisocitrate lyase n=1 Tax=Blepharisma stoltei TaxID=1481888 RepID=A0AAU9JPH2_9CILI|nr:unnamed protein product [Blepharisma stoltei]